MFDILYDAPVYRDIIRYGREKGLLEGLEEGLAKGQQEKIQELRETLLEVILELFPTIRIAAQEHVDAISDTLLLRQLIVKIVTFKTPEEALQYLRDITGNNEKH